MHEINPQQDCRRNGPDRCRPIGAEKFECGGNPLEYPSGYSVVHNRHNWGDINVVDYDVNLRPPQRREFLFPAIYNGGCEQLYCNNTTECPATSRASTSLETRRMFHDMFGSYDPYSQVMTAPSTVVGPKCNSAN